MNPWWLNWGWGAAILAGLVLFGWLVRRNSRPERNRTAGGADGAAGDEAEREARGPERSPFRSLDERRDT